MQAQPAAAEADRPQSVSQAGSFVAARPRVAGRRPSLKKSRTARHSIYSIFIFISFTFKFLHYNKFSITNIAIHHASSSATSQYRYCEDCALCFIPMTRSFCTRPFAGLKTLQIPRLLHFVFPTHYGGAPFLSWLLLFLAARAFGGLATICGGVLIHYLHFRFCSELLLTFSPFSLLAQRDQYFSPGGKTLGNKVLVHACACVCVCIPVCVCVCVCLVCVCVCVLSA